MALNRREVSVRGWGRVGCGMGEMDYLGGGDGGRVYVEWDGVSGGVEGVRGGVGQGWMLQRVRVSDNTT